MKPARRLEPFDAVAVTAVLVVAALVSLFALRSNDVWWMLAVGRRMAQTHAFIRTDPFAFTTAGMPWVPQAWASALAFHGVHALGGDGALVVLRAAMVVALCALLMRAAVAAGAGVGLVAPAVLTMLAVSRTRMMVRGHLVEYVLLSGVLLLMVRAHRARWRVLLATAFGLQVAWTNAHPSFLLGPATAAALAAGAWLAARSPGAFEPLLRLPPRRAAALTGAMAAACLVNPAPATFLSRPFDGAFRELLTRFTLEWKSPFDPALAGAAFHPWYEILLALSVLSAILAARRLAPGLLALVVATAAASFQSHRFRVEFAIVAALSVAVHLARSGVFARLAVRAGRAWPALSAAFTVVLAGLVARGHVDVTLARADRWPDRALEFIVREGVAHRPFHALGVGSYMTWALYGQRQTFIDGRQVSAEVYRDFLAAQSGAAGWRRVRARWRLDAAILPPVERADAGMRHVLAAVARDSSWALVHVDDRALVYVDTASVDRDWLARHAYRAYDPVAFGAGGTVTGRRLDAILRELDRALAEDSTSARTWIHRAAAMLAAGRTARAREALDHARRLAPGHPGIAALERQLDGAAPPPERDSREALERAAGERPGEAPAWRRLAVARARAGDAAGAIDAWRRVVDLEPGDDDAWLALAREQIRAKALDEAMETARRATRSRPDAWVGWYLQAEVLMRLGRTADAIAAGERARSMRPRAAGINMLLAKLYTESRRYDEALARLAAVLEVDPDNAVARRQQAWIREQLATGGR